MVGTKDFFSWVEKTAFPTYGVGRMFKVGREEIVGLLAAVEQYVSMDGEARVQWAEDRIAAARKAFGGSTVVSVERLFPNEAGQPFPQMAFRFAVPGCSDEVLRLLREGDPSIFTMAADRESVFVNPMTLRDSELDSIVERMKEIEALFLNKGGK